MSLTPSSLVVGVNDCSAVVGSTVGTGFGGFGVPSEGAEVLEIPLLGMSGETNPLGAGRVKGAEEGTDCIFEEEAEAEEISTALKLDDAALSSR